MELASESRMSAGVVHVLGPFEVPGLAARHVRIYLPPGFRRGTRTPLLYMFDGQNLFDDGPAFGEGWRLHALLERLAGRFDRLPVVVGVDHGGERRLDELSPFRSEQSAGRAEQLLAWMGSTLAPAVARELRLLAGREQTFVGGSSMGGLCALYALFRHPEIFSGALCMSPSFWFADEGIFSHLEDRPLPPASRVYLDVGEREGPKMLGPSRRMASYLASRGLPSERLRFRVDKRGGHNERDWRRRMPDALRFLLGERRANRSRESARRV